MPFCQLSLFTLLGFDVRDSSALISKLVFGQVPWGFTRLLDRLIYIADRYLDTILLLISNVDA